ncbi:uncharacterized protein LOC108911430 isoform X2 [Anoplophora glabripennis]|uniref:uncharacterized protein LOC108911430 isoform X2 n=1 Tax=Anoplophora glabripennis TaxID=217634 RepID=UPI0008753897|nr:uncharacterized protein LOC108911430 isoform X2 [Anoplophora glabripennis]
MFETKLFCLLFPRITRKMSTSSNKKIGQITTIGINRPERRNCVDFNTATLIKDAIQGFEEDDTSCAAVLYGTGGNFCSGFDLNELVDLDKNKDLENVFKNGFMGISSKYVKKPMVAAINGYAVAEGLELALMCDLRVMEETAVVGFYGRRFGIPLTDGAAVRLQAMVGLSRALDMVLTGRSLNAKEAFDWGVANRIVACGTALGQAINLASSLIKFPQDCLIVDRESTYNAAYNKAYDELMRYEQKNSKKVLRGVIEGAKKFISGLGRHGKTYNLTERSICEWEREFSKEATPKSKL